LVIGFMVECPEWLRNLSLGFLDEPSWAHLQRTTYAAVWDALDEGSSILERGVSELDDAVKNWVFYSCSRGKPEAVSAEFRLIVAHHNNEPPRAEDKQILVNAWTQWKQHTVLFATDLRDIMLHELRNEDIVQQRFNRGLRFGLYTYCWQADPATSRQRIPALVRHAINEYRIQR
jgi:hypothetical protein